MSHRAAQRVGAFSIILYALSMVLPAVGWRSLEWGYQLAVLSFVGTMEGMPVCMLGFAANAGFLAAWGFFMMRSRQQSFASFWVALPVPLAMLASYIWLDVAEGDLGYPNGGFVAWFLSGVLLAWAGWRARFREPVQQRGFEVLPVVPVPVDRV